MTSLRAFKAWPLGCLYKDLSLTPATTAGPTVSISRFQLEPVPSLLLCMHVDYPPVGSSAVTSTALFTVLSWQSHPINA